MPRARRAPNKPAVVSRPAKPVAGKAVAKPANVDLRSKRQTRRTTCETPSFLSGLAPDALVLIAQHFATPKTLISFRKACKATHEAAKGEALAKLVLARHPVAHCLQGFSLRQQLVITARVEGLVDPTQPLTSYRRAARELETQLRIHEGDVPLCHYRTLCALALSDACSQGEFAIKYELGRGALGLEALGNFGESVRTGLSKEWHFFLTEEPPRGSGSAYRAFGGPAAIPRRFCIDSEPPSRVPTYIALMYFDRLELDVVSEFLQTLDEQFWIAASETPAGAALELEIGDEVHSHVSCGAIGSIASTLDRFSHEPAVQLPAFRCLADLCMDYFSGPGGVPPVTRRGRSRFHVNTERLEERRVACGACVDAALRAATEEGFGVNVKSAAMLFLMEWVEGRRDGTDDCGCNKLDASRVNTLVDHGAIDVVVDCIKAALLEKVQDEDVPEEEQVPLLIRDLGNFEHVAPMTFVLFALCEGSGQVALARRRHANRLGAVCALCELMLARVAAEEDDPLAHPDPRGALYFLVQGDDEARLEALHAGADPAWLAPPEDEPGWRWNGIVSADAEAGLEYM